MVLVWLILSASILSIIGGQKRFLKLKKEHNYRYFAHIMLFACLGMLRAVFIDLFFHYLKEKTAETGNLNLSFIYWLVRMWYNATWPMSVAEKIQVA